MCNATEESVPRYTRLYREAAEARALSGPALPRAPPISADLGSSPQARALFILLSGAVEHSTSAGEKHLQSDASARRAAQEAEARAEQKQRLAAQARDLPRARATSL